MSLNTHQEALRERVAHDGLGSVANKGRHVEEPKRGCALVLVVALRLQLPFDLFGKRPREPLKRKKK